jgi:hypothetical protein
MGLFDRYEVGDCGMLRSPRDPHEQLWREVYQREKGLLYGMPDSELRVYLKARRGQIFDPYYGDEDTLH